MKLSIDQKQAHRTLVDKAVKLRHTMETEGWKEIIEPEWEKSIASILGGKVDGRWMAGKLNGKCRTDETIAYYIGYKDALITWYNSIRDFLDESEVAREALRNAEKAATPKANSYTKKR